MRRIAHAHSYHTERTCRHVAAVTAAAPAAPASALSVAARTTTDCLYAFLFFFFFFFISRAGLDVGPDTAVYTNVRDMRSSNRMEMRKLYAVLAHFQNQVATTIAEKCFIRNCTYTFSGLMVMRVRHSMLPWVEVFFYFCVCVHCA